MMMGDEEMVEKRKSSYELDDADAFKEAINVMLGNIGIALRDHQEKDLSLSQQETTRVSEEEGMLVFRNSLSDDAYVLNKLTLKLGDFPESSVYRLYAIPLAKVLCGAEITDLDQYLGVKEKKEDEGDKKLDRILNVSIPVIVSVAIKEMSLEEVLNFSPGYIIQFNKDSDDSLDLLVNDKKIGEGEAITIEERFGLQIKKITSVQQKIKSFLGDM